MWFLYSKRRLLTLHIRKCDQALFPFLSRAWDEATSAPWFSVLQATESWVGPGNKANLCQLCGTDGIVYLLWYPFLFRQSLTAATLVLWRSSLATYHRPLPRTSPSTWCLSTRFSSEGQWYGSTLIYLDCINCINIIKIYESLQLSLCSNHDRCSLTDWYYTSTIFMGIHLVNSG